MIGHAILALWQAEFPGPHTETCMVAESFLEHSGVIVASLKCVPWDNKRGVLRQPLFDRR